ncbi:hypothetical protein [Microbacterium sp. NPDC089695]|uniref:hypothetical protein n=1 Tax=Microbacterium sp. NPDC089695 TaxID=3364198 RepID=UPI00381A157B
MLLPLATTYVDFHRRFRSALDDLRRAYQLSISDLAQDIASVSTDIFFVRLDQTTMDGTIPFKQATALLGSIQKMVRAAATTAANPEHSHTGRRPAAVNEFLEDDLRFGHTKRGSFIITVAARVDDPQAHAGPQALDIVTREASEPGLKPFSRRVMETLASGLAATKRHLADGEDVAEYEDFESARVDGMSYELVQSLLEVSDVDGLHSVDLSFQWATAGPPAPPITDEVTIRASELDRLQVVRDRLKKVDVPEQQTLTGRVTDLSREELGGGQEERSILLEAEVNGGLKKIKVPLTAPEYDWAIFAHQRRLLLTVSGTPVRRGRWVLDGEVSVDTRFLEIAKREEEASGRSVDDRD